MNCRACQKALAGPVDASGRMSAQGSRGAAPLPAGSPRSGRSPVRHRPLGARPAARQDPIQVQDILVAIRLSPYRLAMGRKLGLHMRAAALWTGLFAFVLWSLIGFGIMPARAGNGALVLVICTGDGVAEMAFDPVTMTPVSDKGKGGTDGPGPGDCPWAAGQSALALDPPRLMIQPRPVAGRLAPSFTETVLAVSQVTGLPPATGPPTAV